MTDPASPARACRRRRLLAAAAAFLCELLPVRTGFPASPAPAGLCSKSGAAWCVARRFSGSVPGGELGFRFGEPLDVDGDGRSDVAAGARFKLWHETQQNGSALVLSGRDGGVIRAWEGPWADGLFGHWVMPVPDVSGDGLADVVVAAPHARVEDGSMRGIVVARSPKTGEEVWKSPGADSENLGWDMTLAGDENGDGHPDLFVGAPAGTGGRVYLLSGSTGKPLRSYAPQDDEASGSFGWYVALVGDLDGDGRGDLAVGAPFAASGDRVGAAWVLSSATGRELHHWTGTDRVGGFGNVVAAIGDIDGDGTGDVMVTAPGTEDLTRTLPGEVVFYSGANGRELRRWAGSQPGESYGRMVIAVGDLDGDRVEDVAVGAPWHRRKADRRVGRVELRSGRTGAVLAELLGDGADCWFGWHVRRAPDPDGKDRPALLIGSLRHPVAGSAAVGVIDLYVRRDAKNRRR